MKTEPPNNADLQAMQDAIYRDRVRRARRQTEAERLADAFELTNGVFARMLAGANWQLGSDAPEQGAIELRARLHRLRRVQDHGRFVTEKPLPHDG